MDKFIDSPTYRIGKHAGLDYSHRYQITEILNSKGTTEINATC
jgi:hypothetical protein